MSPFAPPSLADYLRSEARVLLQERNPRPPGEPETTGFAPRDSIRVPLELGGAIWAAEVEEVGDRGVKLLVDRDAVVRRSASLDATIRYQPDNCGMQRVDGTIKPTNMVPGGRVRVEFSLK